MFRRIITLTVAVGLLAVASASASVHQFQSPSRNIGCYIDGDSVRCDIRARTWSPPRKPASCPSVVSWGQGLQVGRGRATFVCAGDTVLGAGSILGYGKTRSAGRFSCTSRESGMSCRNRVTGHGFFLSRTTFRLT